jgi:predicted AAA+ superfamily ATPase
VAGLAEEIFTAIAASDPKRALTRLLSSYSAYGSGTFALYRAFKWKENEGTAGLVPITDLEKYSLENLIGYREQKAELLANTEQFLSGKAANNILLFGDSGTGKSSSVKALLNEPGFVGRGLRMIEIRKDQYRDITEIMNCVRVRNYRFILFIDDLSFEEFEVEYKHLKAVIEGSLERKPDNALIYATSNRRKLIREVWKDRKAASDDVHGGDTMQEKYSLSDRFGVRIWYGSADQALYLEMVKTMASEEHLSIPNRELERMALQWEVGRGGYTGRTARQFIQHARHL